MELSFVVEKDRRKQDYLRSRFPHAKVFFNDMNDMGHAKASTFDGSFHKVPKVRFLAMQCVCVCVTSLKKIVLQDLVFGWTWLNCVLLPFPRSRHYADPLQVDLLCSGFPCVSVSPLTTTPGSVLDKSCQSGAGFDSVFNYAAKHKPSLLLLENVSSLFHKRAVEGGEKSGQLWCA